MANATQWLTWH